MSAGDTKYLLTASTDSSVRLWEVSTGQELMKWDTHQPSKCCALARADQRLAAFATQPFSAISPSIRFIRIADIPGDSDPNPILQIDLERPQTYVFALDFSALSRIIIAHVTANIGNDDSRLMQLVVQHADFRVSSAVQKVCLCCLHRISTGHNWFCVAQPRQFPISVRSGVRVWLLLTVTQCW